MCPYLTGGNLESMTSYDSKGELDKYFYTYDNAGLISGINRDRRGFEAVSGHNRYQYDEIGRLTQTTQVGTVGPQEYGNMVYPGGGNQVQILNYSDRAKLIPVGPRMNIY